MFVGAAAQDGGPGGVDPAGGGEELLLRFDRAGTGDDGDRLAADDHRRRAMGGILDLDGDHRFLGMEIPPRQLVLRGDSHHLIDACERFKCFLQRGWQGSADNANDGSLFPF